MAVPESQPLDERDSSMAQAAPPDPMLIAIGDLKIDPFQILASRVERRRDRIVRVTLHTSFANFVFLPDDTDFEDALAYHRAAKATRHNERPYGVI